MQFSLSETTATTAVGQLISRVLIRNGRIGLPGELNTLAPTIDARFTRHEGFHAIVDTDAFILHREKFDLAAIAGKLTALHDDITQAFEATVTPHALATWA